MKNIINDSVIKYDKIIDAVAVQQYSRKLNKL